MNQEAIYQKWIIQYSQLEYKIFVISPEGKKFLLYGKVGTNTKLRDRYGNKLYNCFSSIDESLEKGKLYIDTFPDRLDQYLQNKLIKLAFRKTQRANQ